MKHLAITRGRWGLLLVCFLAACAGHRAGAAPAGSPTLADALGRTLPPARGVTLAVGAENITLPPGASFPASTADAAAVAEAFGKTHRQFGAVGAIAPAQMTVLNADPINPNIYEDLAGWDALRLLAASLTDPQWQAMTGESGLGQADLSGDTQRQLFADVLPQALRIVPRSAPGAAGTEGNAGLRDLSDQLGQVHLRLRRRVEIMVPEAGSDLFLPANAASEPGSPHYLLAPDAYADAKTTLYGVPVKANVPNSPKPGDLDFARPEWQTPVTLAGVKTVGGLVLRVGVATHQELYADARWEARTVTLRGPQAAVPASDLLRALAFCLAGAYRKVGAAFVLTDDTLGAGTRRERWRAFETAAGSLKRAALSAANTKITANHALPGLMPADDSLPLSAAQQKEADAFYARTGFRSATQTLEQLTPAQQASVLALAPTKNDNGTVSAPNPAGRMIVQENPALEMLLPALDGPIDAGLGPALYNLFDAGHSFAQAEGGKRGGGSADTSAALPSLPVLLQSIARRAVLLPAPEPADMDALVAKLRALGLNEWWIVLPASSPAGANEALLRQAIRAAAPAKIAVLPVIDLLEWSPPVPAALADLTLLGQTSVQAQGALAQVMPSASAPETQAVAVSPLSPIVQSRLAATMQELARVPGAGGIVWRQTTPPGYAAPRASDPYAGLAALGCAEPMRLAFLRARHADPLDLFPDAGWTRADTSLPLFDNPALEARLLEQWQRFRIAQNTALLQSLHPQTLAGAAGIASPLPLFVQSQGDGGKVDWFGTWDSPKMLPPTFRQQNGTGAPEKVQAKAQSKIALVRLPLAAPLSAANILSQWADALEQIARNKTWDGFVLDVRGGH